MGHQIDVSLSQDISGDPCCVSSGVVLHQDTIGVVLKKWLKMSSNDLGDVMLSSHADFRCSITENEEKRAYLLVEANCTPYDHTFAAPTVSLGDVAFVVTLTSTSSNADSSVVRIDTKVNLIREKHSPPVVLSPVQMISNKGKSSCQDLRSQNGTP